VSWCQKLIISSLHHILHSPEGVWTRALSRRYFAGGGAPGVCGRRRQRADCLWAAVAAWLNMRRLQHSAALLSWNSMGPTRISSPTSARGCRRVRRLLRSACHDSRARHADDPRRLVLHTYFPRKDPRVSIRDARVYTCTVHDILSCTRFKNYTIGASLMSVSVSVSAPWMSALMAKNVGYFSNFEDANRNPKNNFYMKRNCNVIP